MLKYTKNSLAEEMGMKKLLSFFFNVIAVAVVAMAFAMAIMEIQPSSLF